MFGKFGAMPTTPRPDPLCDTRPDGDKARDAGGTSSPHAAGQDAVEPRDGLANRLAGGSAAMVRLRNAVRQVARVDAPVLIIGPSGSGKDAAARAIHNLGPRAARPFVAVNCAAIPAALIEAELFGHDRGAFTGAIARRPGLFEQCGGGTLFLDEIGDMPAEVQVRLLRVLEAREYRRVGGTAPLAFDGRILCATHRDLPAAVRSGGFRADLWYRLAVLAVQTPALAARPDDIPVIVAHLCRDLGLSPCITPSAMALLQRHDWPGNVRELRSLLIRAAALFPDRAITAGAIPALINPLGDHQRLAPDDAGDREPLHRILAGVEREHILHALRRSAGVVATAAQMLGIKRTTMVEKMRRLGIDRPERDASIYEFASAQSAAISGALSQSA